MGESILRMPAADGDDRAAREGVRSSLAVALQLALAFAVVRHYELGGAPFVRVLAIASLGWLLQHALPTRLHLGWFLVVGAASVVAVAGPADGAWVLAFGAGLVALCLLPGSRWMRLGAVLAGAAGLATLRAGWLPAPFGLVVWPVLASFFLFRAISYLYDRHHERERPSVLLSAAYFLLPPNACFPVFPVVDFGALRRGYEPAAGAALHQEGVERIVRGLLQLVFYRLVYQLGVLPIGEVADAADAVRFLVTNVLLVVRIMGMFHVSVGLLHLYGFRLPPTTYLPFASPGPSEFWRRANVYWRDFVVKVFFYPIYFQLKHLGRRTAQTIAILSVFAAAWFLHSWQWFWFRGDFPLRWQDGAYWSAFGLLVAANGLVSSRPGARRRSAQPASLAAELARAARIAGTFAVFAVLWSVWMTPSLEAWLGVWRALAGDGARALVPVFAALGSVGLVGALWPDPSPVSQGYFAGRHAGGAWVRPWRVAPAACAALAALLLLDMHFPTGPLRAPVDQLVAAISETGANAADRTRRTEGYYQQLAEVPRLDTAEWQRDAGMPRNWVGWTDAGLGQHVPDLRRGVFKPSVRAPFKGAMLGTNVFGMRDREYARAKPAGVVRIALLGPSIVAGSGVEDDQTFEALTERRLREEGVPVEILNFATPGYRPVRYLAHLERAVLGLDPDWVVVAGAGHVWADAARELADTVKAEAPIEPTALRAVAEPCRARVHEGRDGEAYQEALRRCLEPENDRVVEIVTARMAELARERGFRLAWLEIPTIRGARRTIDEPLRALLAEAGFVHLDASQSFAGQPREAVELAPWDTHFSVLGHRLVADRLYALLTTTPGMLAPVGEGAGGGQPRGSPAPGGPTSGSAR